ncbi:MAG: CsgG/HfaB family protein [Candidatus Brocadiia bacterium]
MAKLTHYALTLCLLAPVLLGCASTSTSTGYTDDDSKCGIYPPPPVNFAKKRLAVIPLSDKTSQKFTKTNLGSQAVDIGTTLLLATERFTLVEREKMDALLAEQKLVGIVDPATAAKAGKILGADLIFTGAVTDFEIKRSKRGNHIGIPSIGKMPAFNLGKEVQIMEISMAVDGRIVETETARVIFADSGEIKREEKAEGWHFGLYDGGGYSQTGSIKIDESAAGKQLRFALDNLIQKMVPKIDAFYTAQPEPATDKTRTKRIKELLIQFSSEGMEDHTYAARTMVEMEAVPDMIKLLEDADPDVRSLSAWALGELRAKEAAPAITKLLEDPEPKVREAAREGLRLLEQKPAPVQETLEETEKTN